MLLIQANNIYSIPIAVAVSNPQERCNQYYTATAGQKDVLHVLGFKLIMLISPGK